MVSAPHRQGLTATGRASFAERGVDLYETHPVITQALLRTAQIPHRVWEPAAGRGAIVDVLRGAGHNVLASDLVDYQIQGQHVGRDFLREQLPKGCQAIVTNPPFKAATDFIRHAIELGCPQSWFLLRLAFYEGSTRSDVLEGPLARVLVFRNRVPRMHRDGWDGPIASNSIAFAWFLFEPRHRGRAHFERISWR